MGQMGPFGDVGPCILEWNSTPIQSTDEGAEFRLEAGFVDVHEAEHGRAAVDAVFTGYEQVEFSAPFTRVTYAGLATLIPGSSRSGESGSGGVKVYSNITGRCMYALAQELTVKRIVDGIADTDTSRWLHIFKTYPVPQFRIPYTFEGGQRGFMVLFKAFPDSVNSNKIWCIGADFS